MLYPRAGNHSGTEEAGSAAATQVTRYLGPTQGSLLGADTPISGVGDEARISVHGSLVVLVARKANVVLTLQYDAAGHRTEDEARAATMSAARTLLGRVNLS